MYSSADIVGNVFWRAANGVFIGGGRDNLVANNIFVACDPAIAVDDRGVNWTKSSNQILRSRLKDVPYDEPPYSERYPKLATILDDDPLLPRGNRIEKNILADTKGWLDCPQYLLDDGILAIADNFIKGDPGFVAPEHGDFRFKDNAPAKNIGFKPIPFNDIGLYADEYRHELPDRAAIGAYEDVPPPPLRPAPESEPLYECTRVKDAVVVDGKLDEWGVLPIDGNPPMQLRIEAENWTGPEDSRFRIGTQYDDNYVYVAVEVHDDVVLPDGGVATWFQDGVELRLDARPKEIRDVWRGYTENKETVTIILSPGQDQNMMRGFHVAGLPDGTKAVCMATTTGYNVEAAIPVDYFNKAQGQEWTGFRMNVSVDDADQANENIVQLCWKSDWRSGANFAGSGSFTRVR